MRILFMGTPQFALVSLQKLLATGENIIGVVTQPDRPCGRGRKTTPPLVKTFAQEQGLPVFQPEGLKDYKIAEGLRALSPHLIIVVAYGKILPREILAIPPAGCINVHASLLPHYRGAAPIHWSLMRGEKITGVTTMYLDEGMDDGDIILQQEVTILSDDTVGSLHDKLAHIGADLLAETVARLKTGSAPRVPQNHAKASYAPTLTRKDEIINWARSAEELWFQVRGLNHWPGATTFWQGRNLKIWEASPQENNGDVNGEPGEVVFVDNKEGIYVLAGEGVLRLENVQPAGRKPMTASDFARGYGVEIGMVFGM